MKNKKGNIVLDVVLITLSLLAQVVIKGMYPDMRIGGLIISFIITYFVVSLVYVVLAILFKLPQPKISLVWPW
ncbi:MAG: hypothetical protein JWN64_271 [Parcubacteria group bacterium]|nr:hypothetical protein [Parcubacteria group bacterium]